MISFSEFKKRKKSILSVQKRVNDIQCESPIKRPRTSFSKKGAMVKVVKLNITNKVAKYYSPIKGCLKNAGKSSYLNAALNFIIQANNYTGLFQNCSQSKLLSCLSDIATIIKEPNIANTSNLFAVIQCIDKQFNPYTPNDFLSALVFFLNNLKSKSNYQLYNYYEILEGNISKNIIHSIEKDDYSPIDDLFMSIFAKKIDCDNCHCSTLTFDANYILPIDLLRLGTIEECITAYFNRQIIHNYMCDKCKVKAISLSTIYPLRFPPFLVVYLKRSIFEAEIGGCIKLNDFIRYPHNLNLHSLISKSTNQFCSSDSCIYQLFGVCLHTGYGDNGHYFTYFLEKSDMKWYCYDDEHLVGLVEKQIISQDSVALFYVKPNVFAGNIEQSEVTVEFDLRQCDTNSQI